MGCGPAISGKNAANSYPEYHKMRRQVGLSEPDSAAGMLIASWFVSWTIPVKIDRKEGIKSAYVAAAVDHIGEIQPFLRVDVFGDVK